MAALFTSPKFSATDANGNPLAGGKVYTYSAGTLTPKATYTTQAGNVANANPVILDSTGRADIWLGTGSYKFVVTDSAGVAAPDGTVDNITAPALEIAADLASTSSATKGAGMVGYSATLAYASGTVGKELKRLFWLDSYGAVGDNTTDDYAAFMAAFAAATGGGIVRGTPGATYRVVVAATPVIPAGVEFDLQGCTVNLIFAAGSDLTGFSLRDRSAIFNGTINSVSLGSPTSSGKEFHSPVVVGLNGASLAGYSGWRVTDLTLTATRADALGARGVLVQAGSYDGIIENLYFPTSSLLGCGVQVSWAGPGGSPPATSEHPHNIAIRNIKFGTMTRTGGSFDIAGIDIVGVYNVSVENISADRWAGDALVQIRCGGFGATVAPATIAPLLFKGITVRNVSGKLIDNCAVLINGRANDAVGTPAYSMPVEVSGVKAVGNGASSTTGGVRLLHVYDVVLERLALEQFQRGIYIEERTRRIRVRDCQVTLCQQTGVLIAHGTTAPEDITIERVESWLNGQAGSGYSGFEVDNTLRVQFIDCIAGDATSETTQSYGFRVINTASATKFSGTNRVRNFKAGGAKYLFSAAVYGDRSFHGGSNTSLSTASNEYAPLCGVGLSVAEVDSSVYTSVPMLLTNFTTLLTVAPGAGKSRTLRVVKSGAATVLECIITDTATTSTDYDTVEIATGDQLSVQSLPTGTPAAARGKWSCEAFLI